MTKSGKTKNGETWYETKSGMYRVYTVGGSQAHAELYVQDKHGSWEPHHRNPCEGPFLAVRVEADRRDSFWSYQKSLRSVTEWGALELRGSK